MTAYGRRGSTRRGGRVSDVRSEVTDDPELRQFAEQLWATEEYQSWRDRALHAVADGTIHTEPSLHGSKTPPEA